MGCSGLNDRIATLYVMTHKHKIKLKNNYLIEIQECVYGCLSPLERDGNKSPTL